MRPSMAAYFSFREAASSAAEAVSQAVPVTYVTASGQVTETFVCVQDNSRTRLRMSTKRGRRGQEVIL